MGGDELNTELGPFQIDYISIYENSNTAGLLCLVLFLLWASYLVHLLGNTAETYFSPALASICEQLNLPENIAGVTFLAMGNGAPDVFASLTSFSGSNDVLIGLGGLLGASMFISCIVVGSLVVLKPCHVNPRNFVRDVLFHILGVIFLGFIAIYGAVNLFISICFFLVYGVYVFAVVYSWRLDAGVEALLASAQRSHHAAVIQQAYWYPSENATKTKDKYKKPQASKELNSSMSDSDSLYTFLILKENGDDNDVDEEEDGQAVINLSGGLLSQSFNHNLIEDYFAKPSTESDVEEQKTNNFIKGNSSNNNLIGTSSASSVPDGSGNFNTSNSSVTEKKLRFQPFDVDFNGSQSIASEDAEVDQMDDSGSNMTGRNKQNKNKINKLAESLYWTQVQLRRRIKNHFKSTEFWEYPWYTKAMVVLDYPAVFLRDMTIPTTDSELWSRFNAILQPIFAPVFLLAVAGEHTKHVGVMPITLFSMIMCIIPAGVVFLTTHTNKPPSGNFGILWVGFSFTMCIAWIYLLAGELVACLSSVGEILGIPSSFMGLTILAWGNSVGDYFANVSMAKSGYSEMAVTGCIGGPIFNVFIGLGLSFVFICVKEYPNSFEIPFDVSSVITMLFLFLTLLGTLVFVSYRNFTLDKEFGYILLVVYVVYTLVQFALLL